jgi:DNA-binding GntR family transcriptional regulator
MKTSLMEHEAILKAIRDGEPELAQDLLRDHVAVQGERFSDLVASLEKTALRA